MRTLLLTIILFALSFECVAQKDSLKLRLTYEVSTDETNVPLNIRVDFISAKTTAVSFQNEPAYLLECNLDDIKLQSEVLAESCYRTVTKSDCGVIPGLAPAKNNLTQLKSGDTSTYRNYISLLDRERVLQKHKGFSGNYRFRISRHYWENGQRKQIFSNWLYVSYP